MTFDASVSVSVDHEVKVRCGTLAEHLADADRRLVLAESCTAGLIAASLAQVPGISRYLCGSLVSYRESAKTNWLGVPPQILKQHTAVSEVTARLMATGALGVTPEADLAAAVTGHLGPLAPPDQDGMIYVGVAQRRANTGEICVTRLRRCRLLSTDRLSRQREATMAVLTILIEQLAEPS